MKLAILALFLSCPGFARADAFPKLTEYLAQEISGVQSASVAVDSAAADTDELFLRRWFVRLQAPLGIKVPWVVSLQVIPEVEFVWQRSYPQGWTDYTPGK